MTENVVIIGGGAAGLAAAIYTARADLTPLIIAGSPPGGQLTLTSDVENYPGFESIPGPELIEKLRSHAKKFGARTIDQNAVKVDFSKRPFVIKLPSTQIAQKEVADYADIYAKTAIIATGAKALWLELQNEKRLRGHGVSACATCDGFFFKNKIVAVVGGGDAAMEDALVLTKFASKVYIIHRRDQFRASKIMQERVITNPKIEVVWNTAVEDIIGKQKVEAIKLRSWKLGKGKETGIEAGSKKWELKLDGVFVAIGHKPDTDLFKNQVELDNKGYIITSARFAIELIKLKAQNSKFKTITQISKLRQIKNKFNFNYSYGTSVPGVFAAGDCVDYKYRQAGTAVGMGISAALEVERWLETHAGDAYE